jgi:hypothetical protein
MLRFVGGVSIVLKGPASRRVYKLRPDLPLVAVATEDVDALLRSPLFESVVDLRSSSERRE